MSRACTLRLAAHLELPHTVATPGGLRIGPERPGVVSASEELWAA